MKKIISELGFFWGVLGVIFFLGGAIHRIIPYIVELRDCEMSWRHGLTLVLFTLFMVYAEGVRGFQKKFSPRVVARAGYLKGNLTPVRVLLAPLFCMGYFWGTKKRLIVSYSLTATLVCVVVGVRQAPQPWRGIIDFGVLAGLLWGIFSILYFCVRFLQKGACDVSPETPDQP